MSGVAPLVVPLRDRRPQPHLLRLLEGGREGAGGEPGVPLHGLLHRCLQQQQQRRQWVGGRSVWCHMARVPLGAEPDRGDMVYVYRCARQPTDADMDALERGAAASEAAAVGAELLGTYYGHWGAPPAAGTAPSPFAAEVAQAAGGDTMLMALAAAAGRPFVPGADHARALRPPEDARAQGDPEVVAAAALAMRLLVPRTQRFSLGGLVLSTLEEPRRVSEVVIQVPSALPAAPIADAVAAWQRLDMSDCSLLWVWRGSRHGAPPSDDDVSGELVRRVADEATERP